MAIDLATSLSPYEFENMLPLDVLAAVASETLRNEIHSTDTPKVKIPNILKRQVKKSVTNALTLDDIKSMPVKSLIDKFAEMTSDELTKKYSYKCLLLPQKCTMTFKSFGNEKKACDKIKVHLRTHVEQLISEHESSGEVSDTIFIPRSPNSASKLAEKLSKKSVKKQQISLNHHLSHINSFKASKKEKRSELSVKKVKKKFDANKKCFTEFEKDKPKMFSSVYLEENPCFEEVDDDSFLPDESLSPQRGARGLLDDKDDTAGWCSNYSKHLKYIFFDDEAAKEELSESPSSSEQVSDSNDCDNISYESNNSSIPTTNENSDKSFTFLQDHNYVCSEEVKSDKLLFSELKNVPRKYEDPFLQPPNVQTQLIIRTPPFPFVHIPVLPEVAEIKEISIVKCNCGADECSNYGNYLNDSSIVQDDLEEMKSDDHNSDYEEKYSTSVFYKMNGANSSVLECVENIVNKKHSNSCVPKNEISPNENDENLENMQKVEKELALKYIAKLHSKGKKKIPDSLMCQICPDKHFTAQATLIHHYRSHAGIKPYICKICSAKFTRQHSLNYHMLIHQNRSRFTCDFCGRTFRHPSHYKEHLRRHTGETPYQCTDCNLHFKTRNTFKRHLKTRHGKLLTANGIEDLNAE